MCSSPDAYPYIELDAPSSTRIEHEDSIRVVEVEPASLSGNTGNTIKAPRRFKLTLTQSKSASYELKAIAPNESVIDSAKLRVAGIEGGTVELGGLVQLDKYGRASDSGSGLNGVTLCGIAVAYDQSFDEMEGIHIQPDRLGTPLEESGTEFGPVKQFLDALAQDGSFSYGVARDLLYRLHDSICEPPIVLLELSRLGHIEISTTRKGHFARIHAVSPAFYSLPHECLNKPIWCLAGTPRLHHWALISRNNMPWSIMTSSNRSSAIRSWRLLIEDEHRAKKICEELGFNFIHTPCSAIASFSANIESYKNNTLNSSMESIGGLKDIAVKFQPSKGLFTSKPDESTYDELWRVRDLDTCMDNLYVLASDGEYSFVRDSRWGVWLALREFALWLKQELAMNDVHPIPITYERNSGTLWLPARISPPKVIERALISCSGDSPKVFVATKFSLEGERIKLEDRHGQKFLSVNRFYSDMTNGRWLAYRFVVPSVAEVVAKKLEGALDTI